jgi:L-asparaginase
MKTILIVHTGGTIGMKAGPMGLAPAEGLIEGAFQDAIPQDVRLQFHRFSPLVDSAEIGPKAWNEIIEVITSFEGAGVIVTHGTDTMAFTGAALSQALSDLSIPVVLCGSMVPLGMKGDAEANLALALMAVCTKPTGVWLAFAGKTLPAAGLVKHHSHDADAFRSVPQALASTHTLRKFSDLRLAILTLSAGMPSAVLRAALNELDGAVLRVFGAGTAMSDPELMAALQAAINRGVRIRAVSQCEQGGLEIGAYAAGAALWEAGVENGGIETAEVALIRLWLEMTEASNPV